MRPFAAFGLARLRALRGVLVDLDETITTHGRLAARAYDAVERLHDAGLRVVVVTGRPAGWGHHLAHAWPVDAVVAENGGLYFRVADGSAEKFYAQGERERHQQRARLGQLAAALRAAVPRARTATDQPYRETDLAIDWGERAPRLDEDQVEAVVRIMHAAGAHTTRSNIHVHATFGEHDKLATTVRALREGRAVDLAVERDAFAFVGDSGNDAPMFAHFVHTLVGVANVTSCVDALPVPPAFVTAGERGAGFVEVVDAILAARAGAVSAAHCPPSPPGEGRDG
jgi:hypothetical protein